MLLLLLLLSFSPSLLPSFPATVLLPAHRSRPRPQAVGTYELLLWLDGVLCAQQRVEFRAGSPSAAGTLLVLPASGRLQPEQWNRIPLLIRDAAGNGVELVERHRLQV